MDSLNPEFALYEHNNECARTDTVFFPISQVCTRGVTFKEENYKKSIVETNKHVNFNQFLFLGG